MPTQTTKKSETPVAKTKAGARKTGLSLSLIFASGLSIFIVFGAAMGVQALYRSYHTTKKLEVSLSIGTDLERTIEEAQTQFRTIDRWVAQVFLTQNRKEYTRASRKISELRDSFGVNLQKLNQISVKGITDSARRSEFKAQIEDTNYKFESSMKIYRKLVADYKAKAPYALTLPEITHRIVSSIEAQQEKDVKESIATGTQIKRKPKIEFALQTTNDLSVDTALRWQKSRSVQEVMDAVEGLGKLAAKQNDKVRGQIMAEQKSQIFWLFLLVPFFAVGGGAMAFGLHRQVIRPVRAVAKACEQMVRTGAGKIDPKIPRPRELAGLLDSITMMMGELKKRDNHLKSILTALEDGVFFFDKDGRFAKEHSLATTRFFPEFAKFKSVFEFYEKYTGTATSAAKQVMAMLWAKDIALRFVDIIPLLPQQVTLRGGTVDETVVRLIYKELRSVSGELQKVFVIARDVNAEVKAKTQIDDQNERVKRVKMASADSRSFSDFCDESNELFAEAQRFYESEKQDPATINELKRIYHTLKGSLALYEFVAASKQIHELESALAKIGTYGEKLSFVDIRDRFMDTRKLVDSQKGEISEILGLAQQNRFVKIPRAKVQQVTDALDKNDTTRAQELVRSFDRFALSDVLAKYPRSILVLGEKLGKYVELQFENDGDEISYPEARRLDTALLHIFRNCVDHGIEDETTRMKANKPPEGHIFARAERQPDEGLKLIIRDDGGGINASKLAEKAVKNGLWTQDHADRATDQEKVDLIFAANLSTRDQVTETSGRGVGMDAVKAHLTSMGGSIGVTTKPGEGSTFVLTLPFVPDENLVEAKEEKLADVIPFPQAS